MEPPRLMERCQLLPNLWPDNLSDAEFASLQGRVIAARPEFFEGLAAICERVGDVVEKAGNNDEGQADANQDGRRYATARKN